MIQQASTQFLTALAESLAADSFVKLTLGSYKGTETDLKNIYARRVLIKGESRLAFTYRYKTRDIVKNYAIPEAHGKLRELVGHDFHTATLLTTAFDLSFATPDKLKKTPPSQTATPDARHDRAKNRALPAHGQAWLHDLGITDKGGNVLHKAQDKFRQINKYIEIIDALTRDLAEEKLQHIADMGAGKGYLTFALYDYLKNTRGIEPHVTGIEYRADLVALCNRMAEKSGFKNLRFVQGAIGDYNAAALNMLIALHACDTATDDAIAKGVAAQADIIIVAPCCHKQIRREMERHKAAHPLSFLTRHGIFLERQAEMITDGLRALLLERSGYDTKIFEFISGEHTAKNIMLVATRRRDARIDPAMDTQIDTIKNQFSITRHYLEDFLR